MKKILFAFLIILALPQAQAWDQQAPLPLQQCKVHMPYGMAKTDKQLQSICRTGYFSAYDAKAKIPGYVSYTLKPENALGCVARTNAFVADASVQNGPRPDDYAGTGYDKGHAAPDGDMSWDQQVEYESFLMTNMYPQLGGLNRGIWKLLETSVRGWSVQQNQAFTIYVGAVYGPEDKTIGQGIVVPNLFYKIVVNNNTGAYAGWLFPHAGGQGNDLTKVRAPVAKIQELAKIQFAFPANAKELTVGQEWPVDFGALTKAKRDKCGKAD